MSACDELRPLAAGIATLPEGDPERAAFLEHARGCEGCMRAFREGESLMKLLASAPLPGPSAAALERARAPVAAVLAEEKKLFFFPAAWGPRLAAAALAFVVPVLFAHHRDAEGWAAALVVALAAAVLASAAGALRTGALLAVAASAGFAFAAGGVPGPHPGGLLPSVGVECLLIELFAAALPLGAAAWTLRRTLSPGALAQAAAAGALAGQAALHLTCPGHAAAAHLWVFHVGGVVLAALIGATAGLMGQNREARAG